MTASDVLANASRWSAETSDALVWLQTLPADCAALEAGRRGIGCDLRPDQVELARRRLSGITPTLSGAL